MQLRDYQLDIANKACLLLHKYRIAYLSMQVRTGKTLTALHAADLYEARHVLFVTKLKAISSIEGDLKLLQPSFYMTTINFESVHTLKDNQFDLIIIDEAHSLGQYPIISERTKILKDICEGKPIIYLSGTPSPESYSQLYHQFYVSSFSPFADWKSFYKWAVEFVDKKIKYIYNRQINDYSHADKNKIDELTAHLFLSYSQEEAGFKQMVKEEVLFVKMHEGTYALAQKLIKKRVHVGKDGSEIVADTEVKLQQKLHQIYSGTVIPENTSESKIFDTSKARFIKERFKGKKIAIFYKFKAEALMLLVTFGHDRLTSDPQVFNNSTDKIFASQIQSGREGINLSTAHCLVFLNIDFSALSYWQARARMQVKDQTKECLLYWIFSEGGIEEKIHKAVMNKKDYTLQYFRKDFLKNLPLCV